MSGYKTDVLVVGGGPAGIQGSRSIKMQRPDLDVVVLRPEPFSVIYCAIPYALENLFEPEKIRKRDELVTEPGSRLVKETVVEADLDAKVVKTAEGNTFRYEKLLIVTGAVPFIPPVPGADLKNILTVKTEFDTLRILEKIESGAKHAVVVGAGAIGIEQAQAFRKRGLEVDLIDMAPYPLPAMVDEEFGHLVEEELASQGIRFRPNVRLAGFEGDEFVEKVLLENGESIALEPGKDYVVVAVGVKPVIQPFADCGLEVGKDGFIVNNRMETSHPDVWAAGDCVQFVSGIDGKLVGGKLATNAVPMAKVAAKNIIGQSARYPGFFNGAVTVAGKLRVGGTGFTEAVARQRGFETVAGFGETTSRFPMMPGACPTKVKLVVERHTGRLLGGQVVGCEAVAERIDIITLALQRRLSAAELAELSYSAQPWQTFFPARNAIVQAAEAAAARIRAEKGEEKWKSMPSKLSGAGV